MTDMDPDAAFLIYGEEQEPPHPSWTPDPDLYNRLRMEVRRLQAANRVMDGFFANSEERFREAVLLIPSVCERRDPSEPTTLLGFPFHLDKSLPDGVIEMRDESGNILARIE